MNRRNFIGSIAAVALPLPAAPAAAVEPVWVGVDFAVGESVTEIAFIEVSDYGCLQQAIAAAVRAELDRYCGFKLSEGAPQ